MSVLAQRVVRLVLVDKVDAVPHRLELLGHIDGAEHRHHHDGETHAQIPYAYQVRLLAPEHEQRRRNSEQHRKVLQHIASRRLRHGIELEHGREVAVVRTEEQVVDERSHHRNQQHIAEHRLALRRRQTVEHTEPDDECARGEQERLPEVAKRRRVSGNVHEFRRGRLQYRNRYEQAHEQGHEDAAEQERALFVLRGLVDCETPVADRQQAHCKRRLQQQAAGDHEDLPLERGERVYEQDRHQQRQTRDGSEDTQHALRILHLVEEVLHQREQVVERPVEHQARG